MINLLVVRLYFTSLYSTKLIIQRWTCALVVNAKREIAYFRSSRFFRNASLLRFESTCECGNRAYDATELQSSNAIHSPNKYDKAFVEPVHLWRGERWGDPIFNFLMRWTLNIETNEIFNFRKINFLIHICFGLERGFSSISQFHIFRLVAIEDRV